MGDVGGLLDAAPVSRAAVLEERYRSRLPETLDDLTGPGHGTVQLPLHVAWSGQTAFNLDLPKACMHMYRIVLAEGQRGDVAANPGRMTSTGGCTPRLTSTTRMQKSRDDPIVGYAASSRSKKER
jgi:hypothetical protein